MTNTVTFCEKSHQENKRTTTDWEKPQTTHLINSLSIERMKMYKPTIHWDEKKQCKLAKSVIWHTPNVDIQVSEKGVNGAECLQPPEVCVQPCEN